MMLTQRRMRGTADKCFLELLDKRAKQNLPVLPKSSARNFAPKVMAGMPGRDRVKRRDFEGALERLLNTHVVKIVDYGPASRGWQKLAIASTESTVRPHAVVVQNLTQRRSCASPFIFASSNHFTCCHLKFLFFLVDLRLNAGGSAEHKSKVDDHRRSQDAKDHDELVARQKRLPR